MSGTMKTESGHQPLHIAVIMDGNGRWARLRGSPRAHGHQAGFRTTRDIVEACGKLQIESLTLFAFSSENWKHQKQQKISQIPTLVTDRHFEKQLRKTE